MSDLYRDLNADNTDQSTKHCSKRNHIKPCWCGGVANCTTKVGKRRCRRIVTGSADRCWQHGLEAGDE